MIRQLLDFARHHLGGGFALDVGPLEARLLVCEIVQGLQVCHPDRVVQCVAESAPGDFQVEWDADRISQVLVIC